MAKIERKLKTKQNKKKPIYSFFERISEML